LPPINSILALNHRIGYNTTAIELLLPTWKAGVIDLRKRVRAEGRTHCWRERASLGPPCSSRHRVEPQARISLDRPKLQSQPQGVSRSLAPRDRDPDAPLHLIGPRLSLTERKLVAIDTKKGSESCSGSRNLIRCLGGRRRKETMQTRNRGDYTIAGCELVAEGADLRVQVLSRRAVRTVALPQRDQRQFRLPRGANGGRDTSAAPGLSARAGRALRGTA